MSDEDASKMVGHKCRDTIKKYDQSKSLRRLMLAKMSLD